MNLGKSDWLYVIIPVWYSDNAFSVWLQYVTTHLQFLQYTLQEGALYLPWSRARDIWGTLIASSEACNWDREVRDALSVKKRRT